MSTRLKSIHFPPIKDEDFIAEIDGRLYNEIKSFNNKFSNSDQLKSFVRNCDSDMRSFANYY